MKIISCIILSLVVFVACKVEKPSMMESLRGMYRLERFDQLDTVQHQWVPSPVWEGYSGYIIYDGVGHMAVHLSPKGYRETDVSKPIDSLNPEELRARAKFYQTNYTYFANAKVTDSFVVHSKLSATNPRDWGTDATRDITLISDTLYLTTREKIGQVRLRLKWIKLR
jgi:Lipocalin-like domain